MNVIDIDKFNKLIPDSERNVKRLKYLKEESSQLRVAVFGKYNHGKSTLLNTVIGKDIFKAADKRETRKNAEHKHNNIIWVDTPGLGADVKGQDDKEAMEGAFKIADILYLVHNVQAGELDKNEIRIFRELTKQDKNYRKKMFLILTQIDQVQAEQQQLITTKIKKQLKKYNIDLTMVSVSAALYRKGVDENKPNLVKFSYMDSLLTLVSSHLYELDSLRKLEAKRLVSKIRVELNDWKKFTKQELQSAKYELDNQEKQFKDELVGFLNNIKTRNQG